MASDILSATARDSIIHDIHHDLESAYWVLLWLILRYTKHTLGHEVCKDVFVFGNDLLAAGAKVLWITKSSKKLVVEGNAPLTTLLLEFRSLLYRSADHPKPAEILNHDSALEIFRKAISQEKNWPKDDFVQCTPLDRHIGTAVAGATGTSGLDDDDWGLDVDVPIEDEDDDDDDPEEEDGPSDDEIHSEAAGLEEALEALEVEEAIGRGADQDEENEVGAPLAQARSPGPPAATRGDGPCTHAQTKRQAAAPAEPITVPQAGPSNGGGSSKRRKLNASAPLLLFACSLSDEVRGMVVERNGVARAGRRDREGSSNTEVRTSVVCHDLRLSLSIKSRLCFTELRAFTVFCIICTVTALFRPANVHRLIL